MKTALAIAASLSVVSARDVHVGMDAPTIFHAIKAALPGDTIHLEPKVYRDYAGFYGKKRRTWEAHHAQWTWRDIGRQ